MTEMCEDQPFDFGDLDLKFLELTPPRPTQGAPAAIRCTTPLPNMITNSRQLSTQVQNLAKRIASNDALIQEIKTLQRDQKGLRKQLQDFQVSAKGITKLYDDEKKERYKQQRIASELQIKCETLAADLASIRLANDQITCKLEYSSHLPVDYNDLSMCFMRLYTKLEKDEAQHWRDQGIAEKIRKYCMENSLFVPEKRSPKKRKTKAKKMDIGTQCELWIENPTSTKVEVKIESRSQGTQYEKIELRSQGTQHIGTTTTRSTCTSSFIKKHNVSTSFPEPLPLPPINDMLNEMLKWDIKPVSPLPINLNFEPSVTKKKSTGTCTLICNTQRTIDYVGGIAISNHQLLTNIKRSNSRPPSRNVTDGIKNEVTNPPPSVPTPMHTNCFPQLPTSLSTLNSSTFDDLWQVFGQMLFGLLKSRSSNELSSTRQHDAASGIPISQQDFQSWFRSMYEELSAENTVAGGFQSAEINNISGLQEFRNGASMDEETARHSFKTVPMSIQDLDRTYISTEDLSYSVTDISPGNTPLLEFAKIHIPPAIRNSKKKCKRQIKKCKKNRDAIVNEILELFPSKECSNDKKEKIAKLISNESVKSSPKNITPFDETSKTIEAFQPKDFENAVDFLTQLETTFNEANSSSQDLSPQKNISMNSKSINENLSVSLNSNNYYDETNIFSKPNEKIAAESDYKMDEFNLTDNSTETLKTQKDEGESLEKFMKREIYAGGEKIEKSDNLEFSTATDVNESSVSYDSDADYVNEIEESNLIIDEYYDAGSSQIKMPTDFAKGTNSDIYCQQEQLEEVANTLGMLYKIEYPDTIRQNFTIGQKVDSADDIKSNDTTMSPITLSVKPIIEDLQNDALPHNMTERYSENHTQAAVAGHKDFITSSLEAPLITSDILSIAPKIQNLSKNRVKKRKIYPCSQTSIACKRSARLIAKQNIMETIELSPSTPLATHAARYSSEEEQFQSTQLNPVSEPKQCEGFHSVIGNDYLPKIDFFKERNLERNNDKSKKITSQNSENINDFALEKDHHSMSIPTIYVTQQSSKDMCKHRLNDKPALCASTQSYPSSLYKTIQATQTIQEALCDNFESPASPTPSPPPSSIEQNNPLEFIVNQTKEIPLERDEFHYSFESNSVLKLLYKNYNNELHKLIIAESSSNNISKVKQKQINNLNLKIQEFLTTTFNETELDTRSFMLAQQMQEISKNNVSQIVSAIVEQMQNVPRPEIELACKVSDVPAKYLGKLHRKMSYVMRRLQIILPEFSTKLLDAIENKLFNFKDCAKLSLYSVLNLTQLYLLTISNQLQQIEKNPSRLFISKCLYFHKLKAIPMIYEVLCCFPTTLPHKEDRNYDNSDALISVIKHILMCTKYDMDKTELRTKELLSKLRFEYHFECFKPDRHEILNNLIEKLKAGKLENVSYAFALFCKRLPQPKVEADILQAKLLPLANEFYPIALNSSSHDPQIGCLLESLSMIIRPFEVDTDVSIYSKIFARFLNAIERPAIQEAAVQAILRMQRFGCYNCFHELINFNPNYELQPVTLAMLQTFVHRKPLGFWKQHFAESRL